MTTTNTRFCDPNAAAGGDGTTNALSGANCAYVSLAAWELARQADLVSGDIIEDVECASNQDAGGGSADVTSCTIDGWTTGANNYVNIRAKSSHGGKWNNDIYRLEVTVGASPTLVLSTTELFVRFSGIQAKWTNSSVYNRPCFMNSAAGETGDVRYDKCIAWGVNTGAGYGSGFRLGMLLTYGVTVTNCLGYGFINGSNGTGFTIVGVTTNGLKCRLSNCTAYDCGVGYSAGSAFGYGTAIVTNCGAASCASGFSVDISQTTCSSSAPTFADADNDDFHLAAGDTTWRGGGTDLSAYFTDDIDGETRSAWDIGCDEYVALATGNPWYYYAQL